VLFITVGLLIFGQRQAWTEARMDRGMDGHRKGWALEGMVRGKDGQREECTDGGTEREK
jgi:hypothetical protein